MSGNSPLILFATEIGLLSVAVICIGIELFCAKIQNKLQVITQTAMGGIALVLVLLLSLWGRFGTLFSGSFVQDGYAYFFKVLFLISGLYVLNMTKDYFAQWKAARSEFVLLILFALIGMCFLVSANDFVLFFVALETLTISLYINTAYLRDNEHSIESGIKFLILGSLSTALLVYGFSFIFGTTGSTSYTGIEEALVHFDPLPIGFIYGMILVLVALGFKMALVPFQFWVPDVYQGAPTPITAFLAMGSKTAAVGALLRLLQTALIPAWESTSLPVLLAFLSAITIIYGNLGALVQTNIKRLLAYSSISHAGYLAMGLAAFNQSGKEAVLYYLLSYVFATAGAFMVVILVSNQTRSDDIKEFAGLSQESPVLAAGMLLALFSLAGMPPLAGFFAKFYVLSAAVESGFGWLAFIGVINVVVSLFYYLKIIQAMYVDKPFRSTRYLIGMRQHVFQFSSMAGVLILGCYPGPFVGWIHSVYMNFLQF